MSDCLNRLDRVEERKKNELIGYGIDPERAEYIVKKHFYQCTVVKDLLSFGFSIEEVLHILDKNCYCFKFDFNIKDQEGNFDPEKVGEFFLYDSYCNNKEKFIYSFVDKKALGEKILSSSKIYERDLMTYIIFEGELEKLYQNNY
jgi:hypothetical protein